jgi:hypothetical protein
VPEHQNIKMYREYGDEAPLVLDINTVVMTDWTILCRVEDPVEKQLLIAVLFTVTFQVTVLFSSCGVRDVLNAHT